VNPGSAWSADLGPGIRAAHPERHVVEKGLFERRRHLPLGGADVAFLVLDERAIVEVRGTDRDAVAVDWSAAGDAFSERGLCLRRQCDSSA
jgi:hypothetical protein